MKKWVHALAIFIALGYALATPVHASTVLWYNGDYDNGNGLYN